MILSCENTSIAFISIFNLILFFQETHKKIFPFDTKAHHLVRFLLQSHFLLLFLFKLYIFYVLDENLII